MPTDATFTAPAPRDLALTPPPEHVIALVQGLLAGHKAAEAKFYEAFQPLVKGWIGKWNATYYRAFGLRGLDEEDTCQNVLMRLMYGDRFASGKFENHDSPLRQWLEFDGERSKSLYRFVQWSANFYVRDLRRVAKPIEASPAVESAEEKAEADPGGLNTEERWQLRRCSRTCWGKLNPSHREVLEWVGVMGWTKAETALKLGVSEATIGRWYRDAAGKFRSCLEENCPEDLLPF